MIEMPALKLDLLQKVIKLLKKIKLLEIYSLNLNISAFSEESAKVILFRTGKVKLINKN